MDNTTDQSTELIKETADTLIFKANKPLKEKEFKLLSDIVRYEESKSGMKIVLLPHSADLVDYGVELVKTDQEKGTKTSKKKTKKDKSVDDE